MFLLFTTFIAKQLDVKMLAFLMDLVFYETVNIFCFCFIANFMHVEILQGDGAIYRRMAHQTGTGFKSTHGSL